MTSIWTPSNPDIAELTMKLETVNKQISDNYVNIELSKEEQSRLTHTINEAEANLEYLRSSDVKIVSMSWFRAAKLRLKGLKSQLNVVNLTVSTLITSGYLLKEGKKQLEGLIRSQDQKVIYFNYAKKQRSET